MEVMDQGCLSYWKFTQGFQFKVVLNWFSDLRNHLYDGMIEEELTPFNAASVNHNVTTNNLVSTLIVYACPQLKTILNNPTTGLCG